MFRPSVSARCPFAVAVCRRCLRRVRSDILHFTGDWRSGSAGALQALGRGFKSLIAHH